MKVQVNRSNDSSNPLFSRSLDKYNGYQCQLHQFNKKQNLLMQKENILPTASFITLKPYQKCQSKPNILITPPYQPLQPQSTANFPLQHITHNIHTTNNTLINHSQGSYLPIATSQLDLGNLRENKQQENCGYGIVQNPFPDFNKSKRIQYHNLYSIGKSWFKFEGSFADGCKQGPGTIYLTNGHLFTGFFVKDLANGKGTVYVDGELVLKGTWRDNILLTQF